MRCGSFSFFLHFLFVTSQTTPPGGRGDSLQPPTVAACPTCQTDGQTSVTQKEEKMAQLWKLIARCDMTRARQTARGEKSSCPNGVPADVKLSHYNQTRI